MQSPKRCVLKYKDGVLGKNRTMYNVQKHNICTFVVHLMTLSVSRAISIKLNDGIIMSKELERIWK
jgi:hypothetical protein